MVEKWHPEILHFCPKVPVVLVGNKSDLQDGEGRKNVVWVFSGLFWVEFGSF